MMPGKRSAKFTPIEFLNYYINGEPWHKNLLSFINLSVVAFPCEKHFGCPDFINGLIHNERKIASNLYANFLPIRYEYIVHLSVCTLILLRGFQVNSPSALCFT